MKWKLQDDLYGSILSRDRGVSGMICSDIDLARRACDSTVGALYLRKLRDRGVKM